MEPTAIVTVLLLAQYVFFATRVGKARVRFGIRAPAASGNADFERVFRAHQNTGEQLLVVLPSLWMFSYYIHGLIGAALGALFLISRHFYFTAYSENAAKRGKPFVAGFIPTAALLAGGLVGAVLELVSTQIG